jgi:putative polymerase
MNRPSGNPSVKKTAVHCKQRRNVRSEILVITATPFLHTNPRAAARRDALPSAETPIIGAARRAYPSNWVTGILVATVGYLSILSFLNTQGLTASPVLVGLVEAAIYTACLGVQLKRLPLQMVGLSFCIGAWIMLTWLIRQVPDFKGVRDLIIPVLFFNLGRYVADVDFADRVLKLIICILAAVGLFEVFFTDIYANLFNPFSFYVNIGGINESAAQFSGQLLTLNGFRPEGIGRTILPELLGPHRASSLLMEPVALGNFSVILMAWALSKPMKELRKMPAFALGAALLITLSDSRFGLMMGVALMAFRALPVALMSRVAPLLPFLILGVLVGLAWFLPSDGDNLLGRITLSGVELLHFDSALLMGLGSPLPNYGDMGYAYLLSRFGAPMSIALVVMAFLIPMADARGVRFRALLVLYIFSNLAISGTSVFALKTAAIAWFLMGVLRGDSRPEDITNPQGGRA